MEPGQSKPGSADVYVKNCPQASSYFYGSSCERLSAIANANDIDQNSYDPRYAHALAADETEEVRTEMISATFNYDFEAFDAIVVYSDRKVTEDATTDWARIDMDDYVPAPLIVDGIRLTEKLQRLDLVQSLDNSNGL